MSSCLRHSSRGACRKGKIDVPPARSTTMVRVGTVCNHFVAMHSIHSRPSCSMRLPPRRHPVGLPQYGMGPTVPKFLRSKNSYTKRAFPSGIPLHNRSWKKKDIKRKGKKKGPGIKYKPGQSKKILPSPQIRVPWMAISGPVLSLNK